MSLPKVKIKKMNNNLPVSYSLISPSNERLINLVVVFYSNNTLNLRTDLDSSTAPEGYLMMSRCPLLNYHD